MRFKFKIPLLLAVLAVGVMGVSAASAWASNEFLAAKYPVLVKGVSANDQGFAIAGATTVCKKAEFHTGLEDGVNPTGPSLTLLIHPTYTKCEVELGGTHKATVSTTGCNYVFMAAPELVSTTLEIECLAGKEIEVTVEGITGCVIKVPPQTVSGIEYMNLAGNIEVRAEVNDITWAATAGCGLAKSSGVEGEYREGEFNGAGEPVMAAAGHPAIGLAEGFEPLTKNKINIDVN